MNEFKFNTLRQFGSENFSYTATIHSDKAVLTEKEVEAQVAVLGQAIEKAFKACIDREISEKAVLAEVSERRAVEVKKHEDALKAEMKAKEEASRTLREAEKQSYKLTKNK